MDPYKLGMERTETKEEIKELTILEAIGIAKRECKDPYAQTYLRAMDVAFAEYGNNGFRTQILYALNNMGTWRGETARTVKTVMKAYCKVKK